MSLAIIQSSASFQTISLQVCLCLSLLSWSCVPNREQGGGTPLSFSVLHTHTQTQTPVTFTIETGSQATVLDTERK